MPLGLCVGRAEELWSGRTSGVLGQAGSIHIDRDVLVSHGRLRVVEGTSRNASVRGAVA